ncbi:MAG TPA: LptF/LptG family permease [Longimicrobiales bacterium]
MRILTRYLLRAHLGPFLFSLSVLTGLLLINTVARRFQELAGKGLPISVIAEVFVLSIPYTLALTLPMSVLVAVLYVFSQLTADNEITALKASGVSLVRLLAPLLFVAALLAGGMVWFNDRVLPEANHELRNLLVDIGRKSPTLELREQVINEIRAGNQRSRYFLQAAKIEPIENRLYDVVIYDLSAPGRDRTIYADSGRMAFNAARTDLYLTLHDGWINERSMREPDRFLRMFYDEQVIRMAGVGNVLERDSSNTYRGDREMSVAMLMDEIAERQAELEDIRAQARRYVLTAVDYALRGPAARSGDPIKRAHGLPLDAGELRPLPPSAGGIMLNPDLAVDGDELSRQLATEMNTLVTRAKALREGINRYRVELHKKYAIPFACIVFVLIGAPLAVRFPRGGVGMVIAFSLLIFSIYWMGLTGGENLGDKGHVSPIVAMWAINVLFLGLGVWAFARLGREMSTARGGGWDDLLYTLRGVAARGLAAVRRRRPA